MVSSRGMKIQISYCGKCIETKLCFFHHVCWPQPKQHVHHKQRPGTAAASATHQNHKDLTVEERTGGFHGTNASALLSGARSTVMVAVVEAPRH